MREIPLTLPEIGMINSTRFIIGTGVGLLIAAKLDNNSRRAVGWSLVAVGMLVSIPVGMSFLGKFHASHYPAPQLAHGRAA